MITILYSIPIFLACISCVQAFQAPVSIAKEQRPYVPLTLFVPAKTAELANQVVTVPSVGPRWARHLERKKRKQAHKTTAYNPWSIYRLCELLFSSGSLYLKNMSLVSAHAPRIIDPQTLVTETNVVTVPATAYTSIRQRKRAERKASRQKRYAHNPEHKSMNEMNYDELVRVCEHAWQHKDKLACIRYLEQMLRVCSEPKKIARHIIELADLYFQTGNLKKAKVNYLQFVLLNPGAQEIAPGVDLVEYAQYRAVLASFYMMLDPERDQSDTRDTVELANTFLERTPVFNTYVDEVKKIRNHCYEYLAHSDLVVCEFYVGVGDYESAQRRLHAIEAKWVALVPDIKDTVAHLQVLITDNRPPVADIPIPSTTAADNPNLATQRF